MSASAPINIERINNRLPLLGVGLGWDSGFASQEALNNAVLKQTLNAQDLDKAAANPFYIVPPQNKGQLIDMQLVVVALGGNQVVAHVDGDELEALDGALAHTGDDKSGADGGWDELANVALNSIPPGIEKIAVFAHCRSGHNLSEVPNLKAAIFAMRDGANLLAAPLGSGGFTHLFAVFVRKGDDFVLQPVQARVHIPTLADVPAALANIQ